MRKARKTRMTGLRAVFMGYRTHYSDILSLNKFHIKQTLILVKTTG